MKSFKITVSLLTATLLTISSSSFAIDYCPSIEFQDIHFQNVNPTGAESMLVTAVPPEAPNVSCINWVAQSSTIVHGNTINTTVSENYEGNCCFQDHKVVFKVSDPNLPALSYLVTFQHNNYSGDARDIIFAPANMGLTATCDTDGDCLNKYAFHEEKFSYDINVGLVPPKG